MALQAMSEKRCLANNLVQRSAAVLLMLYEKVRHYVSVVKGRSRRKQQYF
jgi:hypothetical protein